MRVLGYLTSFLKSLPCFLCLKSRHSYHSLTSFSVLVLRPCDFVLVVGLHWNPYPSCQSFSSTSNSTRLNGLSQFFSPHINNGPDKGKTAFLRGNLSWSCVCVIHNITETDLSFALGSNFSCEYRRLVYHSLLERQYILSTLDLIQGSPYDILFTSFLLQGPELDLCFLPSLDYQKIERAGIVTVLDQGHPPR